MQPIAVPVARPARAANVSSMSRLKSCHRPLTNRDTRGWVIPRCLAASACVHPLVFSCCSRRIITTWFHSRHVAAPGASDPQALVEQIATHVVLEPLDLMARLAALVPEQYRPSCRCAGR